MPPRLLAVPNISEGRDPHVLRLASRLPGVIDVHADPDHHRAVVTILSDPDSVVDTSLGLLDICIEHLDISAHHGVHPRHGVMDVLPFVIEGADPPARAAADRASEAIGDRGIPVHRYGPDHVSLPELRRRLRQGMARPDQGPDRPHPTAGVVCVGERPPLIAFNVEVDGDPKRVGAVVREVRDPTRVRALAMPLATRGHAQVSMNLIAPDEFGPRGAYERVVALSERHGLVVGGAEIVGLVPDRFGPQLQDLPLIGRARTISEAASEGPLPI